MNLDLKLIVHGVPNGQSIWGADDFDKRFIDTFYGLNSETQVQLRIDIQKLNSIYEVFYTYYRIGNVFSQSNRGGSYFAFTIKSNYFYTDIFNIYNILNATFEKLAKDKIYTINENNIKFSINDFNQINSDLKDIERNTIEYLSNYSNNEEFIPLNNFNYNLNTETIKINLLECNNKEVINEITSKGKASISSSYPIKKHIQEINNKNEELNQTKIQCQQYIDKSDKKHTEEIQNLNKNNVNLENKIREINSKYEFESNRANKLNLDLTNYIKEHKNKIDLKSLHDEVLNLSIKFDNRVTTKSPLNIILLIIILINTIILSINIIYQNDTKGKIESIIEQVTPEVTPPGAPPIPPEGPVVTPPAPPVTPPKKEETTPQKNPKENKNSKEKLKPTQK